MNKENSLPEEKYLLAVIKNAFLEDLGRSGDVTTNATIPAQQEICAKIVAKEDGIIAGQQIAGMVFHESEPKIAYEEKKSDAEVVCTGDIVSIVSGPARAILCAERIALNFLGRLSGIASLTGKFVRKIKKYNTRILDTRKTTPGLRYLEKYAVRAGGGCNHRMGLYDMVLIKDNQGSVRPIFTQNNVPVSVSIAGPVVGCVTVKKLITVFKKVIDVGYLSLKLVVVFRC